MISAPTGSSPKVIGSRMAMVAIGPTPGSTPTRVPTRQPRKQSPRFCSVRATEKPSPRLLKISDIAPSDVDRGAGDDQDRHRLVEKIPEQADAERGHDDREEDELLRAGLVRRQAADDERQRAGDDEPEQADGEAEGDDAERHEHRAAKGPFFEAVAVADEADHEEQRAAKADPDGEPARQHRRPHRAQRPLRQVADEIDREQRKRDERNSRDEVLRATDRAPLRRGRASVNIRRHRRSSRERYWLVVRLYYVEHVSPRPNQALEGRISSPSRPPS